jgi:hypothetical protein
MAARRLFVVVSFSTTPINGGHRLFSINPFASRLLCFLAAQLCSGLIFESQEPDLLAVLQEPRTRGIGADEVL